MPHPVQSHSNFANFDVHLLVFEKDVIFDIFLKMDFGIFKIMYFSSPNYVSGFLPLGERCLTCELHNHILELYYIKEYKRDPSRKYVDELIGHWDLFNPKPK